MHLIDATRLIGAGQNEVASHSFRPEREMDGAREYCGLGKFPEKQQRVLRLRSGQAFGSQRFGFAQGPVAHDDSLVSMRTMRA
jgi:hypothetical protein